MRATKEESLNTGQAVGMLLGKQICSQEGFRDENSCSGSSRPMQSLQPDVLHPRVLGKLTPFPAVLSPLEGHREHRKSTAMGG